MVSLLHLAIAKVQGIPSHPGKILTPTLSGTDTLTVQEDIKLIPLLIQKSPLSQFALTINLLPTILALFISNSFYTTGTSKWDT